MRRRTGHRARVDRGGTVTASPEDPGVSARDPGLQPERTRLAWRRTTLAFTVVTVLAARGTVSGEEMGTASVVGLAFTLLMWLGFLLVAQRRIRLLGAGARPGVLPVRAALAAVGFTVTVAASAAAIVR
ncbi:DUF202 domain-containing protein [Streptomyces sp. NPDC051018]|uniref:DUF202 domain-containing protein n=1 Tax=Streptomyces sp. NPDC051018 TaxID=3365639 RepID=UPI00379B28D3